MRITMLTMAAAMIAVALAGCVGGNDDDGPPMGPPQTFIIEAPGYRLEWAPGAWSTITSFFHMNEGAEPEWPEHTLFLVDDVVTTDPPTTKEITFLTPPYQLMLNLTISGEAVTLGPVADDHPRFIDGWSLIRNMQHHQREFYDRNPGTPQYSAALDWAGAELASFGYDVAVDPYGFDDLPNDICPPVPVSGQQACPASFANVVATRSAGPTTPILTVGGHYDIVPQVTHGAYDNTGGSLAVFEVAKAMQNITPTSTTWVFGMWGGEESGLLGSSFWLASNTHLRPRIHEHINMDVVGMTWPAPLRSPRPMNVDAGLDLADPLPTTPVVTAMLDWYETIQMDWMAMPPEAAVYQGAFARSGRLSDHIPFAAEGIPSVFLSHSGPLLLAAHQESDTLANMSKQALWDVEHDPSQWFFTEEEHQAALDALARSFEPYMWTVFYDFVLRDLGVAPFGELGYPV